MLTGAIIWGIFAKFRNKMADISPLINSLYLLHIYKMMRMHHCAVLGLFGYRMGPLAGLYAHWCKEKYVRFGVNNHMCIMLILF